MTPNHLIRLTSPLERARTRAGLGQELCSRPTQWQGVVSTRPKASPAKRPLEACGRGRRDLSTQVRTLAFKPPPPPRHLVDSLLLCGRKLLIGQCPIFKLPMTRPGTRVFTFLPIFNLTTEFTRPGGWGCQ